MFVFSIFELSARLEEAVTALQTKGIGKEDILVVPLNRRNESKALFDTVHYSDNASTLALPFILAIMLTLIGSIVGFQLKWGPVLWGFISAVIGFAIGLAISLTYAVLKKRRQNKAPKENTVVIVKCDTALSDMVQDILWSNTAIGVNTLLL